MNKKLFNKFLIVGIKFAVVISFSGIFVLAQEGINAQTGEQHGPSSEEIQQFEKEFGGPPQSFPEPTIERPQFEQPGSVPEEVKKYVSDKDLVAVYCAMTRWKSGQFFSAMDAVKKYVIEPTQQVEKDFDITLTIPDVDTIKAEGQKKVEDICGASTVAQAEQLVREFADWGQNQNQAKFDSLRSEMQDKLKTKGDGMREKIKTQLQPYIDEQKASIEAEIKVEAQRVADRKVAEIEDRLIGAKAPPDVNALKSEVTQAVESAIQSIIEQKKAEMQTKVQAKVQEIIGPEKAKFEKIGELFQNVDQKIDEYVKTNQSQYEKYKEEAFKLRKDLVFKILDKNLEEGLKKLDESAADIAEGKKEDPSIKDTAEMKAELQSSRKALEAKLDTALEAGDENAFQQALNDFRMKWETVQQEGEKAMEQSASKVCTIALAQFDKANAQMEPGIKKIKDLQAKCAKSTSDECLTANKFSSRLETINSKFTDLKTEMSLAAKMCQNPQTADRENLIALMRKIQSDAEDVKTYGEALEAEKSKELTQSIAMVCSQAIPQLDAAQAEINKNDLVVLENNINKCKDKNTEECSGVNSLTGDLSKLKGRISSFNSNVLKAKDLCSKFADEENLKTLADILNALKSEGQSLRDAAKDLQAKQSEKMSEKTLCRAVVSQMEGAKQAIAKGLEEMYSLKSSCSKKTDERCKLINANGGKFDNLTDAVRKAFNKIASINESCAKASADALDQKLIDSLNDVKKDKEAIDKMIADLKAFESQAGKGNGISIEAEEETTSFIYPVNQRPAVNMKETNPSWRPLYFGSGDWYLAVGGEYLTYNFIVPKDGQYNVWVRDYVDNFQARGIRKIVISFDGKTYGTFPENNASIPTGNTKGILAWHKVGDTISLKAGQHTMKVMKQATTNGAAVLDSFYLTIGSEVPLEK